MRIILLFVSMLFFLEANILSTKILYLEQKIEKPPVLSNVIEEADDLGIQGAKLAIKDSKRTSKFLNQEFILDSKISYDKNELIKAFEEFIDEKNSFVVANVESGLLQELLKNPKSKKALIINSGSSSTLLRKKYCAKNLLHTSASDAMLYDGLIQFFVKKDFKKLLLIKTNNPKDEEIADAIKRAAKKFGAKIIEEKIWDNNSDIRRKAKDELPSFTQSKDYDVIVLADYFGDFGEYVYFNSWLPRPVAGTQGLRPLLWHKVIEQWGAAQMQSRFEKFASRWMESSDFSSWIAVRTVVNAITHTKTNDLNTNINYIHSNEFELAAYMGRKLSYRNFNGQLRIPISLVQPRALISTSPQNGFLHPITDLDTLGVAKFEMECFQ